jgi:GT2 family glycosyltransferase
MNYKIAAVVVTYNRLELLKQCVNSLRNQTHKLDEIIIINNSSTDGTLEWLTQQNDLTVITQENSGSAGGQYTGIKTAYEKGYDWIWCFDDDCLPDKNALQNLVFHISDNRKVLNSIVLSSENSQNLSFGLYDKSKNRVYRNLSHIENELIESANFFNGTLLSKDIVIKVGLPIKELFIRGEEYEYFLRIKRAGFKIFTIKVSKVFHPSEIKIIMDNFLFRYEYLELDHLKRFYFIRNLIYITKMYRDQNVYTLIKIVLMDILIISFNLKLKLLYYELKGILHGFKLNPSI